MSKHYSLIKKIIIMKSNSIAFFWPMKMLDICIECINILVQLYVSCLVSYVTCITTQHYVSFLIKCTKSSTYIRSTFYMITLTFHLYLLDVQKVPQTLGQPFTLWLWPFFFCKCNKVVIRLACTATKLPPTPEKNIEG